MADSGPAGRPRRRAAKRAAAPSAVHYVGYVEDEETPEMIMKKFEELEKVQAAARQQAAEAPAQADAAMPDAAPAQPCEQPAGEGEPQGSLAGLTDAQLLEVFKQTSIFNVRSALAGNEALLDGEQAEDGLDRWSEEELSDDEGLWADVRGFWSDEEEAPGGGRRQRQRGTARREPRARGLSHAKPRHDVVTHYNAATQALIRRRVRAIDKDALLHIRVPLPLPLSWGRTVQPYVPASQRGALPPREGDENADGNAGERPPAVLRVADVLGCDWGRLRRDYQGVLINPGWEVPGASGAAAVAGLARLPLPRLCPTGFLFLWLDKRLIAPAVKQLSRWGYSYIENLTWVLLHAGGELLALPAPHVRCSHLTLFLFRRGGQGKDIELRHQRNPDVFFDCVRSSPGQAFAVPEEAYVAIETLLPTGAGRFLELWADGRCERPGWTRVAQLPEGAK